MIKFKRGKKCCNPKAKYGEASAAIAAEMYDATAALAGTSVPAAVPAETATYGEVTAAVKKSAEYSNQNTIASAVARLVKQAGADTTIQNAVRDNAQWAWIPSGDTCAFCIALASRGWQYASKRVMKGDHAEHIHANCDCTFAVRFDEKSSYDSYDPQKCADIYYSAEGSSSKDKINSIRRDLYKTNGDTIREQKRFAYTARKERASGTVAKSVKANIQMTAEEQKAYLEQFLSDKAQTGTSKPVTIGGMDVTLTKTQFGFENGSGGIKKTVDAVIYETQDGTKFVFPKSYNKAHQQMTAEQALSLWSQVPADIHRQAQKSIQFVDYYNPQDSYWRKMYKNFKHSYATGGQSITFYRYDHSHNDAYVIKTYCHEAGHFIDTNLATNERFSSENLWTKAISDDIVISDKKSCTAYGENSTVEDFTESISEYVKDKDGFEKDFPYRAAILATIISI